MDLDVKRMLMTVEFSASIAIVAVAMKATILAVNSMAITTANLPVTLHQIFATRKMAFFQPRPIRPETHAVVSRSVRLLYPMDAVASPVPRLLVLGLRIPRPTPSVSSVMPMILLISKQVVVPGALVVKIAS